MTEKLYKSFKGPLEDATGCYGYGSYDLRSLPVTLPRLDGRIQPCRWGYHVVYREHLVHHLGKHIAEVECPDVLYTGDKGASPGPLTIIRLFSLWTPTVQRLFAADCAARVLHFIQNDPRPVETVFVARQYALGRVSQARLRKARDAAHAAVHDAGHASACAAARDAAHAAVCAASHASACNAAYAAAHDAGHASACAAAYAAAHVASHDAAYAAAYAAARFTAYDAQTTLLFDWLEGRRTPDDVRHELEAQGDTND